MDYLNTLISKWMPEGSKRVAVGSHPRLSGIMDTINSTLAHGPSTRLPKEFYNPKGRDIIDRIGIEEWFSGYKESVEYRALGIGSLLGDVVSRMVGSVEGNGYDGLLEVGGDNQSPAVGRGGEKRIKFGLSGCHDTTLAAVLTSLGAFEGEKWPPYSSHIALELFRKADSSPGSHSSKGTGSELRSATPTRPEPPSRGLWDTLFGRSAPFENKKLSPADAIGRRGTDELTEKEKERLQGYYVRIRYNDRPMLIPGCRASGNHLDGDDSFCTLVSYV